MTRTSQVVVIGGGQAGLAAGYHLRRQGIDFTILDADPAPGGAWQHMGDSLHLFSPADHSSLPGRLMPTQPGETYPDAGHVVDYLADYEERYDLPVQHGTSVGAVRRDGDRLLVEADPSTWRARAVVSATGTWSRPFVPAVPGRDIFTGRQLHTVNYRRPADFAGQHVVVVGGGNSGAQIAADLALAGDVTVTWATQRPPRFLPDDIDGRILFDVATALPQTLDVARAGGPSSVPSTTAAATPAESPHSATSSPCRPSAPPATPDSCEPSRCSAGSPSLASRGPTAAAPRRTRSSGAPASARPWPTSHR
ncbi:hypothetical protein GCM10027073_11550 [Streptomyces chlorus]